MQSLSPGPQSIAEHVVKLVDVVNLLGCLLNIIFDAVKCNSVLAGVVDSIASSPILIPRLPDASDIDHVLPAVEFEFVIAVVRFDELEIFGENARHVRVALEAESRNLGQERVHLVGVVNRLRENVFVGKVSRRAVHEHNVFFDMVLRQIADEVPTPIDFSRSSTDRIELISGPVDGAECHRIEAVWIKQGGLVVVAENGLRAFLHDLF